MAAYILFEVEVNDAEGYAKNRDLIQPTLDLFGGRFLVRGGSVECLEGSWNPSRLVILEFSSAQKAKEWWNSKEYRPAKLVRQDTCDTEMILVDGV